MSDTEPFAEASGRLEAGAGTVCLFLQGAQVVLDAIGDEQVGAKWRLNSVLEHQTVGGLAAHLARGGVWVVGEYLERSVPPGRTIDFQSAVEYYEAVVAHADESTHRAVRERAADVARLGQEKLHTILAERKAAIERALAVTALDSPMEVFGGQVIRVGGYLETRIVEQCVHLDDLARSVGRRSWPLPEASLAIANGVAIEMATRLHGEGAVLRALYRRGFAGELFPVL